MASTEIDVGRTASLVRNIANANYEGGDGIPYYQEVSPRSSPVPTAWTEDNFPGAVYVADEEPTYNHLHESNYEPRMRSVTVSSSV